MRRNLRAARPALVALVVIGCAAGAALATRGSPAAEHGPAHLAGRAFAGNLDGQPVEIRLGVNDRGTATGGCDTVGLAWRLDGDRLLAHVKVSPTTVFCGFGYARVDYDFEHLLESHPRVELQGSKLTLQSGATIWRGKQLPAPPSVHFIGG
jgi:hypothetical protein